MQFIKIGAGWFTWEPNKPLYTTHIVFDMAHLYKKK